MSSRNFCLGWSVRYCRFFAFAAVAALLVMLSAPAFAQVQNGVFTGTVMDPQGGSVPNADVVITNVGTTQTTTAKTNTDGFYRVSELPVGTYNISVKAAGFKTAVRTNLYLGAGVISTVNFQLELGQATETVTVEAGAIQVQTDDSRLYETIGSGQVANLPLNGRNVFDLISLAPGAVDVTGVSFENGHGTVVNGLRPNFTGFMINGVSDKGLSGGFTTTPNADMVQEFQELSLNMSAQYGNSASATVNVVTKSGTNSLHGSAYEFVRNDAFDANDFFLNLKGVKKPKLRYNQFGATAEGPIWKDHLFFTGSYQGDRFTTTALPQPVEAEAPEWRQAIISALPNSVAARIYKDFPTTSPGTPDLNLTDYVTGGVSGANSDFGFNAFGDYMCPANYPDAFTNLATQFQSLFGVTSADQTYMAANCPSGAPALRAGLVSRTTPFQNSNVVVFPSQLSGNLFNGNEWSSRIDWVGKNDRVFGEYMWVHTSDKYGPANVGAGIHGFTAPTKTASPNLQTSWVHTFSPNWLNEARAGYSLGRTDTGTGLPGVPQIGFDDGSAGFGTYSGYPQYFHENIYTYADMMSFQKGKHNLKVGVDFRRNIENSEFDIARPSYYFFDPLFFALDAPYSQNAGVDPGFSSGVSAQLADNFRHWRNLEFGAYIQDDWKVNRKLTLNIGLRYDLFTRHTEKSGMVTTFQPGPGCQYMSNGFCADAILNANIQAGLPGCNTPFQMSHAVLAGVCGPGGFAIAKNLGAGNHKNFGPRAGFSYDPFGTGKTAIRGGFGVSYEGTLYNPLSNSRWNPPFYSFNLESNSLGDCIGLGGAGCGTEFSGPIPPGLGAIVYGPTSTCSINTTACTSSGAAPTYTGPPANIGIGTGAQATGNINGYFAGNPNTAYLTGIIFPEGIREPLVLNYYFGIQREILPKTVLEVDYVGTQGRHLFRAEQANRLPGERLAAGTTVVDRFGRTLTGFGRRRLNANYGRLRVWDNVSRSWYNALQVAVRHQATRGLAFNLNYAWSHSIDTGSDWHSGATSANGAAAGDGYSLDPTKPELDRGNSTFDIRHRLSFNYVYEFPWMKDQKGFAGHIFGGWQWNGLWAFQSGAHFTPFCSSYPRCDFNFDGEPNDRPDAAVNHFEPTRDQWANGWFKTGTPPGPCRFGPGCFFTTPCVACDGNLGRNTFVGPGLFNTDQSLFKNIKITERFNMQFRFEVFNALNHASFRLPSGHNKFTSSDFGKTAGTIAGARLLQFGLKLKW